MINIGLARLLLNSVPKLIVGQWIIQWRGLFWGELGVGGNFVWCLIIVVIFIGLGGAYKFSEILKSWFGGGGGWEGGKPRRYRNFFYGGTWPHKTPYKDFNLVIKGGLGWVKWLKNGQRTGFIFHAVILTVISCSYSCNYSFSVKILLVKLRNIYI